MIIGKNLIKYEQHYDCGSLKVERIQIEINKVLMEYSIY